MIRKILTARDPHLRVVSRQVQKIDKKVLKLICDLEDILLVQKDPEGVGLAAPQIGVSLRVFIVRHKGKIIPVINPEIVKLSQKSNDPPSRKVTEGHGHEENGEYIMEGCLSLPHYYGPVKRSWELTLKYDTPKLENGVCRLQTQTEKFSGFIAQIIQHEVDHLNGKIFVDRLLEQKRSLYQLEKGEWQEVNLP